MSGQIPFVTDCSPDQICPNCEDRLATETWVGEGGTLALVHGGSVQWCLRCCVEAQIKYISECAERLPGLKRQLAEIDAAESTSPA